MRIKFLGHMGDETMCTLDQNCKYLEIAFPDNWPLRQVSLYNVTLAAYLFRRHGLDCYTVLLTSMNGLVMNVVINL